MDLDLIFFYPWTLESGAHLLTHVAMVACNVIALKAWFCFISFPLLLRICLSISQYILCPYLYLCYSILLWYTVSMHH